MTHSGNDVDGPSVSTGVAKRTSDQTVDDIGAKTKRARSATQEDEFSRGDVSSGGTTTYKVSSTSCIYGHMMANVLVHVHLCSLAMFTGLCASLALNHSLIQKMYRQSVENPDKFWALEAKKRLLWRRDFDAPKRYDLKNAAIQWFPGGQVRYSSVYTKLDVKFSGVFVFVLTHYRVAP